MALQVLKKGRSAIKVFNATALLASGNSSSDPIDIREIDGYLSLQWVVTLDGTVKFEILTSHDGTNFLDVNADIAVAQTKTTGPASDGKNAASITSIPAPFIKIKVTETGGAQPATVTAYLYGN